MLKSEMEAWSIVNNVVGSCVPTGVVPTLWNEDSLPTRDGKDWRPNFSYPYSGAVLSPIFNELVQYAESVGARLAGFSPIHNPHFRGRKFRPVGLPSPGLYLVRGDGAGDPEWPFNRLVAEHLVRVGRVALCNWIYVPWASGSGYGNWTETHKLYLKLFSPSNPLRLATYDPDELDLLRKGYLP